MYISFHLDVTPHVFGDVFWLPYGWPVPKASANQKRFLCQSSIWCQSHSYSQSFPSCSLQTWTQEVSVALFGKLRGNTLCDICVVPLLVWELPGWRRIDSNWYPHFEGPQLIPRHIPEFQPPWLDLCLSHLSCLSWFHSIPAQQMPCSELDFHLASAQKSSKSSCLHLFSVACLRLLLLCCQLMLLSFWPLQGQGLPLSKYWLWFGDFFLLLIFNSRLFQLGLKYPIELRPGNGRL